MKQLTIRGVSREVEQEILKEAHEKKVSLNKAAIAILERVSGGSRKGKKRAVYHDLDHFSGIWKKEEAAEMDRHIALQRGIDEALWKR